MRWLSFMPDDMRELAKGFLEIRRLLESYANGM